MDQKATDEKKTTAKSGEAKGTGRTAKREENRTPVKEANAPRASLLDLYFGEGAKKERAEGTATRQPSRASAERRPRPETAGAERRPAAELPRPGARVETGEAGAEAAPRSRTRRPAERAEARPAAEARPQAERSVAERPAPEARPRAERPAAEARPKAEAPAAEVRPQAERPVAETAPQPERPPAETRSQVERPLAEQPVAERPAAEARPQPGRPAAEARPQPERVAPPARPERQQGRAERPERQQGRAERPERPQGRPERPPVRPERPQPAAEMRPVADGPKPPPIRAFVPRPVAPAPPPPQRIEKAPEPPPRPARPAAEGRPLGAPTRGPRPAGGPPRPDRGDRPDRADRGPRPAGAPGGGRPGGRPGGRGRPLAIPKLDPKVAAEKPETKRPGQNKVVKEKPVIDEVLDRRDRPPEEKLFGRRPGGRGAVVERRAAKQEVTIEGSITVKELAHEMGITAAEVIKRLLKLGMLVTINQELDTDTAQIVGTEFGVTVNVKAVEPEPDWEEIEDPDEPAELKKARPPVVVIMGHVDHGKTTLLDAIRETRVAAGEAGGITQHIGAYQTEIHGKKITFLDTPGHEAFTAMRARGAKVTDIAVLVVAADDGVMPQTVEAINHAKAAGVPIIVAINKIDKPNVNPDRVKTELTEHGLVVEEWGGDVIAVPVSAKARTNLELLLENILLVAEVQDLKANPDKEARGTILESELDRGKGPVGTVLVQGGTLKLGDAFVCGTTWGKVRAMFDDRGRKVKKAGPSVPVQVVGFDSVPEAGDVFRAVADEKIARAVAEKRATIKRMQEQTQARVSLEDFMARVKEGEMRDLNIIVKADVMGSVEALRGSLEKLENEEVRVRVIHGAAGGITESDVMLAAASKAIILGFNVRPDDRAIAAARQQNVDIKTYRVIYEAVDDIKAAMQGMLKPKFEEIVLGKARVQAVFKVPKVGNVAGCQVADGKIARNAKARLVRDGTVIWEGDIASLKRFKDDVREVTTGQECGIGLEGFNDIKEGDVIEAFTVQEVKAGE